MIVSPLPTYDPIKKPWYASVSYKIWSEFSPPIGQEHWHCDMKRGFTRVRKREPQVAAFLNQDNIPQRIGLLAQRGVYEFHQSPHLLSQANGCDRVIKTLQLHQELAEVQEKVFSILQNYYRQPILLNKNVIHLNRGDEGIPDPILIEHGSFKFQLYAAIDCIFVESNGTIHILDFKTGTSQFDKRQAYVYLLAAKYLYPNRKAIASFYNLETNQWSNPVTASDEAIESICIELKLIARRSQQERYFYKQNIKSFNELFPANPSFACQYCPFHSICDFSIAEAS
ncbi:MAG: PD-(D/E)XK nuclease family protein [Hydrococcus sp. Prado102]|nr:PD-(D/E)XK nuclease family protein [Hydrococcus sp. Prado102]